MKSWRLALLAALLLAGCLPLHGQERGEIALRGGLSVFNHATARLPALLAPVRVRVDFATGGNVGLTGTRNFGGFLGLEGNWLYQRGSFRLRAVETPPLGFPSSATVGMRLHHFDVSGLLYATRPRSRVRPFGSVGVGVAIYQPTEKARDAVEAALGFRPSTDVRLAWNYGAGVKVRITRHFGLRWDISDYVTGIPRFGASAEQIRTSGRFHNLVTTIGASVTF